MLPYRSGLVGGLEGGGVVDLMTLLMPLRIVKRECWWACLEKLKMA